MGDKFKDDTVVAIATVVELGGSVFSLMLMVALQWNDMMSGFCLETCVDVTQEDVNTYWTDTVFLIVVVVATFIAAWFRRAERAWLWHVIVAILAVFAITGSEVSMKPATPDPMPTSTPDLRLPSNYHPCYSGSNNCVGG